MTLRLVVFGIEIGRLELTERLEIADAAVFAPRVSIADRGVKGISRWWTGRMVR